MERLQVGDLKIASLLFADDVVLMASSAVDLQHSLDQFVAECEAAGMRISTSKSEAMVLSRKPVDCLLWVGNESLPQVKEFKYLIVLLTSEGMMGRVRVRSSAIREGLGVEPLLLCMEKNKLRWFGGCHRCAFLGRCSWHVQLGGDYLSSLAWEHLGIPQAVLADVAGEREVWGLLLKMLPPRFLISG